jgi:RimJ/RimL family protein N-acetyltransferase
MDAGSGGVRRDARRTAGGRGDRVGARPPAKVPDRYPPGFERVVGLADGRQVFIRPIVPADAPELDEAIRAADPDTLRRRFLGAPPKVTPRLLDYLTCVDYVQRFALVAQDATTGEGVAVARYEGSGDGTAEVAVVVGPAWRRVGLATVLVRLLAEAARDRGIHAFSAFYLAENRPVTALIAEAGGTALIKQGIAEALIALNTDDPRP